MTRTPVRSSNIAAIAYDPTEQRMEVQFTPSRHGEATVYEYHGVGELAFVELSTAPSVGHAFSRIRGGYPCRKIAIIGADGIERPIAKALS